MTFSVITPERILSDVYRIIPSPPEMFYLLRKGGAAAGIGAE
jgi:hypothetical protein